MKVIIDDPLCPLPPDKAAKLIKFYLNLYPDLVSTLTEYFPKQVIRKQTTFNRTIKVKIPTGKKSEFAVKLAKELAFTNWFFQGYYLMVAYHSEVEYQRLTRDITKIAKSLGVKGLSFKGIKGVIREQKKKTSKTKENKSMLTTVEFDNAVKKVDTLLDKGHLTDSEDKELDKLTDKICEYEKANGISVPDIYGVDLAWQLALEYGYNSDKLKTELGEELYNMIALGNRNLTPEYITKLAKLFNLPKSVFYPEVKAA
jgi:antitoxin component HigA of HigAB toxin-antitoxin module